MLKKRKREEGLIPAIHRICKIFAFGSFLKPITPGMFNLKNGKPASKIRQAAGQDTAADSLVCTAQAKHPIVLQLANNVIDGNARTRI